MSDFRWSNGSASQFSLRLIVWAGVALANPWVKAAVLAGLMMLAFEHFGLLLAVAPALLVAGVAVWAVMGLRK